MGLPLWLRRPSLFADVLFMRFCFFLIFVGGGGDGRKTPYPDVLLSVWMGHRSQEFQGPTLLSVWGGGDGRKMAGWWTLGEVFTSPKARATDKEDVFIFSQFKYKETRSISLRI